MPSCNSDARILVVDADRTARQRLSTALQDAGYLSVTSATTLRRAVQCFGREAPDLMILDPWIEGGAGFEAVEQMTETAAQSNPTRFLFLTADASEGPRIQAEMLGASGVVAKPCTMEELVRSIEGALGLHLPRAGLAVRGDGAWIAVK